MAQVCTALLRALYARDGRLGFVGAGAWPAAGAVPEGGAAVLLAAGAHHMRRPHSLAAPRPLATGTYYIMFTT